MEVNKQSELTTETADAQRRYELIIYNTQECLRGTALIEEKEWTKDDVDKTREFLLACAPFAHPKVLPSYWEHLILSSIYGRKLAELTNHPDINPYEADALLLLHDLGRFVVPHHYLRTDLIGDRLSQRLDIKKSLMQKFPSMFKLIGLGQHPFQTLEDIPEVQRITFVADNIGKRDVGEKLFDIKTMVSWATTQPRRYIPTSPFPSENRGIKALIDEEKQKFTIELLLQSIQWLKENYEIDFDKLREEVAQEFGKAENQDFLLALKDVHESLDINVDRLLGRPPIKAVVFDAGDVLFQGNREALDNELVHRLSNFFMCPEEKIISIFNAMHKGGRPGQISEQHYLRRFWVLAGKKPPDSLEEQKAPFIHPDIYYPPPKMQEIIASLSGNPNVSLYVLSDAITTLGVILELLLHKFYPQIPPENIFISSQVGSAKGVNAQIAFARLLKKMNYNPQSILFIDNNEQYTVSARTSFGIRGFTFRPNLYHNLTAEERLKQELQKAELIP